MKHHICIRKKNLSSGTAPSVSMYVDYRLNCVVVARKGHIAPKNVKEPTGPSREMGSVTSTGADVTSVEKRTSTGRSSPFKTKDSESWPRNCFLSDRK